MKTTVSRSGLSGERVRSRRSRATASASGCKVTIGPTKGEFAGQPARRSYLVRVTGIPKPAFVSVGGKRILNRGSSLGWWSWDEDITAWN